MKDMKWFKKKLDDIEVNTTSLQSHDAIWMLNRVHELYDQLDEPEVLSQEWLVDESVFVIDSFNRHAIAVPVDDSQNLLVPKQELPVIPKFVADYLDFAKSDTTLMRVLELANTRNEWEKWEKEYDWISANDETFARAWLDGYEVKERELTVKEVIEEHIELLKKQEVAVNLKPYYDLWEELKDE